jgi:hypothetical protein
MTTTWFGDPWPTPLEEQERSPIPVDVACIRCERPFEANDRGVTMPLIGGETPTCSYHLACLLRHVGCHLELRYRWVPPGIFVDVDGAPLHETDLPHVYGRAVRFVYVVEDLERDPAEAAQQIREWILACGAADVELVAEAVFLLQVQEPTEA